MEPGEFDALVAKAGTGYSQAVELLQFMRTHKVNQPELVVLHGGALLSKHQRALGSEVWTVMEQVFLASCIVGHDEWRDYCLNKLTKQWPNSLRVERLKGIQQESLGDWTAAKTIYAKILEGKPEDVQTKKRMIAMLKQRGKIAEAVEHINQYLDTFSTDAEVWHELAELYIEAGALSKAVYCFEELTLANPRSMYHVLTYAELLYSLNDFELSRKYFCLACYLDGSCLRALWGLFAVNQQLAEKDKQNEKLLQMQTFCIERLIKAYKDTGPHGKLAIAMLKDSQVSA